MSIRLRQTKAGLVAICAARSVEKPGDIYLSDAAHHALSIKFDLDFAEMGLLPKSIYSDSPEAKAMEAEESNNPARTWWDSVYGGAPQPEKEHK